MVRTLEKLHFGQTCTLTFATAVMSAQSECTEATDRFTEGVRTPTSTEPGSYNTPKPSVVPNAKTLKSDESSDPDQCRIQANDVEATVPRLILESGMHANELLEAKRAIQDQAKRLTKKENQLRRIIQEEVEKLNNVLRVINAQTVNAAMDDINGVSTSLDAKTGELWTALNEKAERLDTSVTALRTDILEVSTCSQRNREAIRRHGEQSNSKFSKLRSYNDILHHCYHGLDDSLGVITLQLVETDRKIATLDSTRSEQRKLETKLESSIKSQEALRVKLENVAQQLTTIASGLEGVRKEQTRMDAQIKDLQRKRKYAEDILDSEDIKRHLVEDAFVGYELKTLLKEMEKKKSKSMPTEYKATIVIIIFL